MTNTVRRMAKHSKAAVHRYLPDAFIFAVLLTIITYILAFLAVEPQSGTVTHARRLMIDGWYGGFWNLLAFAMQMTLILMTGYALAQTDAVDHLLTKIASAPSTERRAAALVPIVAAIASFIHWGLGLVIGAIFARKVAESMREIDFPLIVAGAYSGFLVFHGGLAGSIPLLMNTEGNFLIEAGIISETLPTSQTIFTPMNLILVGVLTFIFLPLMFYLMYPGSDEEKTTIDPREFDTATDGGEPVSATAPVQTELSFADKLERSNLIAYSIGIAGLFAVGLYYAIPMVQDGVMPWNNLNLNIVNFFFLFAGLTLHGSPMAYIESMKEAVENVWGIILQFPFYAGIMGLMGYAPEGSVNLATQIAMGMINVSPDGTLPAVAFLTGGIVNFFVPSGGGEWSVIGETIIRAAEASDTSVARASMATAWGDAWTNMLQPFWAIPLLAISGLSVRDIMGYCVMILIGSGLIIVVGVTFLPM
ncbi:short-chain fatty acid transporter [Natrinema gelatinilyticum]|uniref:short-chain fatty acid transporter n=1 Tax=Natrinema gelatinilyticum TaxID=2961571 RepID=UPI0020C4522D|nr:TIGR00366 family protein [Natrinema gelatinilyticum]